MRVLLLNPPVPGGAFTNRDLMGGMGIDDTFGSSAGPRFVSLLKYEGIKLPVVYLGYAAAILSDHDVTVLEQSRRDPGAPGVLEEAVAARPDWVIAATSFAYLGSELRFLEALHEKTDAKRMLVGHAATFFAEDILRRGMAEVVTRGDPEVACQHLAEGSLRPGLPGVLMCGPSGEPTPAPDGFVSDLDTLPFPRWDGFPVADYYYYPLLKKRPFLSILSARGCPYVCRFCPYPVGQGAPFRPRRPERVVDEMQMLVERHGTRSLLFRDATLTFDLERVKQICRILLERGVSLDWGIETRLDRLDDELVELLSEAGCRSIEFGLDPIEESTLKASKRIGTPQEDVAARISQLERHGIATAGLFVIGLPGQSEDEIVSTLDWVSSLEMSYENYEIATPFPGTPLYAEAVEKAWTQPLSLDDLLAGDPKLRFNGAMEIERMKELQDRALRRFYIRPAKVMREIFNKEILQNVRFMASCGLKFLGGAGGATGE
jgi:anaerobic magnesium-protoporphyrin IX monomethyl ester cyclase